MLKLSYVTIVNENYLPFLSKLLLTHEKFSKINLTVYTVNFIYTGELYENVKFIEYYDNNLIEYENTGINKYIKNDYEKHKYTTFLKPKILKEPTNDYDYFLFVDVDGLFTKNSDQLILNCVNTFGETEIPISVKYFYQYSNTHNKSEIMFNEDGSFNIKSLNYYSLIEYFNTEFHEIHYLTTYCLFYTKNCSSFFKEVEDICYDEEISKDYRKFLPLGDETAFNYLYSKYNITDCISNHLCYDVSPFQTIENVKNNISKNSESLSYIHTKRLNNSVFYGDELSINNNEYDIIINLLSNYKPQNHTVSISYIEKNKIHFCVTEDYNDNYTAKLISLPNPNMDLQYRLNIDNNSCYWLWYENKKYVKDLYLIIHHNDLVIKDCIKIS